MESGIIPMAERVRRVGQFGRTMVQKTAAILFAPLAPFGGPRWFASAQHAEVLLLDPP